MLMKVTWTYILSTTHTVVSNFADCTNIVIRITTSSTGTSNGGWQSRGTDGSDNCGVVVVDTRERVTIKGIIT